MHTTIQAKNRGTQAFWEGEGRNPYELQSANHAAWQTGWDAAKAHHDAEMRNATAERY